jgi:hypothetical protein
MPVLEPPQETDNTATTITKNLSHCICAKKKSKL